MPGRRARPPRWVPAVALASATAQAAVAVLRPRKGMIDPLPVAVETYFSREEVDRARRYSRPQLALGAIAAGLEASILAALSARPPRALRRRGPAAAAVAAAGLTLALQLASLPVSALGRRRALAVGLATQSWRGWLADIGKATAIELPLGAGGGALAIALMRRWPRGWWLAGAGLVSAGGVLALFVGPLLLDPLFNRFTPLPAGELRDDVLELARAAGVRVGNVYEVDASRRTTAANAYVTGIGASRRVVLFDTLTRNFSRDETRLVVAHELAHVRHRDVARSLAAVALTAPAAMRAAARLTDALDRGAEPGAQTLAPLALALGAVSAAVGVIANQLSRAVERRADCFALALTDAPRALISFERAIALRNLADPDPPRWLAALLGTHPAVVARIGIALAYEQGVR